MKDKINKVKVIGTSGREIIESYIFSTSGRSLSIYSERLLMHLVNIAQSQLNGVSFKDEISVNRVTIGNLGNIDVEIPIKSLLGPGSNTNYTQAKKAISELMESPYYIERIKIERGQVVLDENGEPMKVWEGHQILNDCNVNEKPGMAVLTVNKETWKYILDFSQGFRRYDLEVAKSLKKVCSTRIFRLISNQTEPRTYSLEALRKILGLGDRYKTTDNLLRGTIDSAKEELDSSSPWTFVYTKNYAASSEANKGRRGRKEITSITLTPVRQLKHLSTVEILNMAQQNPIDVLGIDLFNKMTRDIGFSFQELKNNIALFDIAKRAGMDLFAFVYDIMPRALRANDPIRYTIGSIQKCLKEKYHVEQSGNKYIQVNPAGVDVDDEM